MRRVRLVSVIWLVVRLKIGPDARFAASRMTEPREGAVRVRLLTARSGRAVVRK